MLEDPMLDPMGAIVAELRADADIIALVGNDECGFRRVRAGEPVGDGKCSNGTVRSGDAQGTGHYQAFIVVTSLEDPPWGRVPVQRALYAFAAYGVTFQNARAVYGAIVKAMHLVGERTKNNGLGIYISAIDSGGEQDKDPDTGQPLYRGVIRVITTAQAIA